MERQLAIRTAGSLPVAGRGTRFSRGPVFRTNASVIEHPELADGPWKKALVIVP